MTKISNNQKRELFKARTWSSITPSSILNDSSDSSKKKSGSISAIIEQDEDSDNKKE